MERKEAINIGKIIQIIQRRITTIAGFKLSINVFFPEDNDHINDPVGAYVQNDKISFYMNYAAYLKLEFPRTADNLSTTDRLSLTISTSNKPLLVEKMQEFLDMFQKDDLFLLDDGKLILNSSKRDYINFTFKDNVIIEFRPTVISDKNNIAYEGAEFIINKEANYGLLSYREFKTLTKVIDDIDIFTYSQLLLNFFGRETIFNSIEMQHRMKDSHRIQLDKKLENLNFGVKPNADTIEQIKKQKEVEIQHRKEVRSEQNRLIEQKMALLKQKRKRDKKK